MQIIMCQLFLKMSYFLSCAAENIQNDIKTEGGGRRTETERKENWSPRCTCCLGPSSPQPPAERCILMADTGRSRPYEQVKWQEQRFLTQETDFQNLQLNNQQELYFCFRSLACSHSQRVPKCPQCEGPALETKSCSAVLWLFLFILK